MKDKKDSGEEAKVGVEEPNKVEKCGASSSTSGQGSTSAQGSSGGGDTGGTDAFEESLMCIICQEILHDCIRYM